MEWYTKRRNMKRHCLRWFFGYVEETHVRIEIPKRDLKEWLLNWEKLFKRCVSI